jgi:hypothetical protein
VEISADEDGPELGVRFLEHVEDFTADCRYVLRACGALGNAKGLAGGGLEVPEEKVIEVRDGIGTQAPDGKESQDHGREGFGTGQAWIIARFFAADLDVVTQYDPVRAGKLLGLVPLPVHRGERIGRTT